MKKLIILLIVCSIGLMGFSQVAIEIKFSADTSHYLSIRNRIKDNEIFIKLDSNNADALIRRALYLFQIQEYERSSKDYTRLIKLLPESNDPFTNRGFCYTYLKQYQLALKDFDKAIKMNPKDPIAYLNKAYAESEMGDYKTSIVDLSRAIKLNPKYTKAYANRAQNWHQLGLYNEAIQDYSSAIGLDSNYMLAYYARGNVHLNNKDYNNALLDYNNVLVLNPTIENSEIYINIGSAKMELDDNEGAESAFAKAIAFAWNEHSRFYFQSIISSLKKNNKQAVAEISKAIELNPSVKEFYKARAEYHTKLGQKEKAKINMDKFKKLDTK